MKFPSKKFVFNIKCNIPNYLEEIMAENCKHVNKELPKFAQLSSIILVDKEFDKTPKRNIKRYLYT